MKRLKINPLKEKKERIIYALFYFFIISFLFKTVFAFMTDSKCLLVSGIFSLFGILMAIVTLMRLGVAYPSGMSVIRTRALSFNEGKLESIIMFGISIIIAVSTSALIFSTGHWLFFHTLYPPQLLAAWIAAGAAAGSLGFLEWIGTQLVDVPEGDEDDITFVLQADFIFSILVIATVVLSRMGATILDYACAIFASFFVILYSVRFLYAAFNGLMDASCDKQTVLVIEKCIRKAEAGHALESLRVNKVGHVIEIVAFLAVPQDMPVKEFTAKVEKIKNALSSKFTKPHEVFVGFVPLAVP